jgi:hypothetical protein
MVRHWTRLGLALLAMAACAVPPSSAVGLGAPTVDEDTRRQLTVVASTLVEYRSQALVQKNRHDRRHVPTEILGVSISPRLARVQADAVEHTEVRYETGKVTQSVRRRFEFTAAGETITLTGERVVDPGARPINDPDPRSR